MAAYVEGEGVGVGVVTWMLAVSAVSVVAGTTYVARRDTHPRASLESCATSSSSGQNGASHAAKANGNTCDGVVVHRDETARDTIVSHGSRDTVLAVDNGKPTAACTVAVDVLSPSSSSSLPHCVPFAHFQRNYLAVRACCHFAELLRGPYSMALYTACGLTVHQRAMLYVLSYAASLLLGTFVSAAADVAGRVFMCRSFCLVYTMALLTHMLGSSFAVLACGRILLGVSSLMLSTVFETWMMTQHRARGYSSVQLQDTNFKVGYLGGAVAVFAGLVAEVAVRASGGSYVAPLFCALLPLVMALLLMRKWTESFGSLDDGSERRAGDGADGLASNDKADIGGGAAAVCGGGGGDVGGDDGRRGGCLWSVRALHRILHIGTRSIARSRRTQLLGVCEGLFDTAYGLWLFCWTLALDSTTRQSPYGLVFTVCMLCVMLGSLLTRLRVPAASTTASATTTATAATTASVATAAAVPMSSARWQTVMLLATHVSSSVAVLLTVLLYRYKAVVLLSFALFEVTIGAYFALHPSLRAVCIRDEQRAAVTTLFLVPSQTFVPLLLLTPLSPEVLLRIAVVLLMASTLCAAALQRYL